MSRRPTPSETKPYIIAHLKQHGKMKNQENRLLTSELLEALANYPLYSQEHKKIYDLYAVALFHIGNIRWYILEGNAEGDRFTFFTLVCGMGYESELGYTDAGELASIAVDASRYGLPGILLTVERAEDFKPCRLGDIDDEDVKDYVARFTDDEE